MQSRCAACHSQHPTMMAMPANGLDLTRSEVVQARSLAIYRQVVVMRHMPLGNLTGMTDSERDTIAHWYQAAHP